MNEQAKILIIDDEPIARITLEALLSAENYQLHFAEDGMEGLSLVAELCPDVILLDVMMPQMNGFDVCRAIRALDVVSEVPILLITALDDRQSRLEGLQSGADDFISKPFDSIELLARLHGIVRLNRYRRLQAEPRRQRRHRPVGAEGRRQHHIPHVRGDLDLPFCRADEVDCKVYLRGDGSRRHHRTIRFRSLGKVARKSTQRRGRGVFSLGGNGRAPADLRRVRAPDDGRHDCGIL